MNAATGTWFWLRRKAALLSCASAGGSVGLTSTKRFTPIVVISLSESLS